MYQTLFQAVADQNIDQVALSLNQVTNPRELFLQWQDTANGLRARPIIEFAFRNSNPEILQLLYINMINRLEAVDLRQFFLEVDHNLNHTIIRMMQDIQFTKGQINISVFSTVIRQLKNKLTQQDLIQLLTKETNKHGDSALMHAIIENTAEQNFFEVLMSAIDDSTSILQLPEYLALAQQCRQQSVEAAICKAIGQPYHESVKPLSIEQLPQLVDEAEDNEAGPLQLNPRDANQIIEYTQRFSHCRTSPLQWAVLENEQTLVIQLLQCGANVNLVLNGATPLDHAVCQNHSDIVTTLLQQSPIPVTAACLRQALECALRKHLFSIAKQLLDAGANPAQIEESCSLLQKAKRRKDTEAIRWLTDAGHTDSELSPPQQRRYDPRLLPAVAEAASPESYATPAAMHTN